MEIQKMLCHKAAGRVQTLESHAIRGHVIMRHIVWPVFQLLLEKKLETFGLFDVK